MRTAIANLLVRSKRRTASSEVEEELRFHIEMLERTYAQHGMSLTEAKTAALRRFGNVEAVKKQCVHISRRSSPVRRVLKSFTVLICLTGLSVYLTASDYKVARIGTVLITIAILGRLLLYVRGLVNPAHLPRTFSKDSREV